ncbi:unnamed protein product [Ascophyllum nodosum]
MYLVNYKANETFVQLDVTYWFPFALTCGCDACNLASCTGTAPILVEYELCNGWAEALALASGLVMYINMVLTLVLVIVLALVPRTRRDNVKLSLWDYVTILSQQG